MRTKRFGLRSYKTKKGGLFGLRAYKTKTDNKTNCHRLAENFKPTSDYLYKKYKCLYNNSEDCKKIGKYVGIHELCENTKIVENYDFLRDGFHLKKRTAPFYDLPLIPQNVDGAPWNDMKHFFKEDPSGEYVLKTEEEIRKEYKR